MHIARNYRLFDATRDDPYPLSRSKVALFLECPRCFVLDRRHGVARPAGPAFTLNLAVDQLLKREFDACRLGGMSHPVMRLHGIDGVPLRHRSLDDWRDMTHGVQVLHAQTNFLVYGAIDDLWELSDGSVAVVDYKATSTSGELTIDHPQRDGYKRQMEIYQWLVRGQGLPISRVGYFLFVNARADRPSFDNRLEFTPAILSYAGSHDWVDDALRDAKQCLVADGLPASTAQCVWCAYRREAQQFH